MNLIVSVAPSTATPMGPHPSKPIRITLSQRFSASERSRKCLAKLPKTDEPVETKKPQRLCAGVERPSLVVRRSRELLMRLLPVTLGSAAECPSA